jgi:hypothetical protein
MLETHTITFKKRYRLRSDYAPEKPQLQSFLIDAKQQKSKLARIPERQRGQPDSAVLALAPALTTLHNAAMGINTVIQANLLHPTRPVTALVLMGGGARTAYQAGVLRALASILLAQSDPPGNFPFKVLVGTSAGAINATCLASLCLPWLRCFRKIGTILGRTQILRGLRTQCPLLGSRQQVRCCMEPDAPGPGQRRYS